MEYVALLRGINVGGTNKVRPGAVITPFPVRDEQRKK